MSRNKPETPPRIGFSGHSASVTTAAEEKKKMKKKTQKLRGYPMSGMVSTCHTREPTRLGDEHPHRGTEWGARACMLVSTRIITCLVHHKQRTWPDVMRRGPTQNPTSQRFNTRPRSVGSLSKCRKSNCLGRAPFHHPDPGHGSSANSRMYDICVLCDRGCIVVVVIVSIDALALDEKWHLAED